MSESNAAPAVDEPVATPIDAVPTPEAVGDAIIAQALAADVEARQVDVEIPAPAPRNNRKAAALIGRLPRKDEYTHREAAYLLQMSLDGLRGCAEMNYVPVARQSPPNPSGRTHRWYSLDGLRVFNNRRPEPVRLDDRLEPPPDLPGQMVIPPLAAEAVTDSPGEPMAADYGAEGRADYGAEGRADDPPCAPNCGQCGGQVRPAVAPSAGDTPVDPRRMMFEVTFLDYEFPAIGEPRWRRSGHVRGDGRVFLDARFAGLSTQMGLALAMDVGAPFAMIDDGVILPLEVIVGVLAAFDVFSAEFIRGLGDRVRREFRRRHPGGVPTTFSELAEFNRRRPFHLAEGEVGVSR